MMGVSYQEMLDTPLEVIMDDLSYSEVEQKVEKHLSKKMNKNA
jgi:hypothetical protein